MVKPRIINPPDLGPAVGFSNGIRVDRLLMLAGQIGGGPDGKGRHRVVPGGLVPQFEKALANVVHIVRAAGGRPEDLVEMTIYLTDMEGYRASRKAIGEAWRKHLGKHYPAMTVVGVASLFEPEAVVELRAVAHIQGEST